MLFVLICLLAGILTILAPCVLPVLPVIIGSSISGNSRDKARPYIIGASLAASIIVFTLLLKVSTVFINLSPNVLDWISGGLLILLGLVTVLPELWEYAVVRLNWQAASQRLLGKSEQSKSKYLGPILIGLALGPVFSSCSPTYAFILASVLPSRFSAGLIYLAAYTLGLAVALLGVSLAGRRLIKKLSWAVDTHSLFRRILGVLFILIGIAIITGYVVKVETWAANHLPFDETKLELTLLSTQNNNPHLQKLSANAPYGNVLNVQPSVAPAFVGLTNWINSPPLTLSQLKGKVVLVDFWTYSCINCIRSIPYVEKWYQTYHSQGFVVVGVSTPEFAFEHNPANVANAVSADRITYPVALDNNYDTWNAYNNDTWPADYLIDKSGNIRYVSLGEGDYSTTEKAIQTLLGIKAPLQTAKFNVPVSQNQSPETYFGTNRENAYIGTPANLSDGNASFTAVQSSSLPLNGWTLDGKWDINPEYITSEGGGSTLTFSGSAKDIYVVAGPPDNGSGSITLNLPNEFSSDYGNDDPNGVATINSSRLYHIVSLPKLSYITFSIKVSAGVSLYTFTFGS